MEQTDRVLLNVINQGCPRCQRAIVLYSVRSSCDADARRHWRCFGWPVRTQLHCQDGTGCWM
uniref:Uncharacterized protein n=1 Tax=Anopheles minimus TaxID=112268 RepID=A0A182WNF0_9DIPT